MKYIFTLFIVLGLTFSLFDAAVLAATQEDPFVTNLIAGRNYDAGDVSIWNDENNLYVEYETVKPHCLMETHLAVATSFSGIPQKNGNPIPGRFPYKTSHNCAKSYTYVVPLPKPACNLYIAAHAALNNGQTCWGNGPLFPGRNWATYIVYPVVGCGYTPTPTNTPNNTPTQTPTGTATSTSTYTPTSTATNTPTSTPTSTATATQGNPPIDTPTSTPTNTSTNTPTETITPASCQSVPVKADFSKVTVGASVEGMGVVAPGLEINAKGTAVRIMAGLQPILYNTNNNIGNGGVDADGGFSDYAAQQAAQAHLYTFTFASGTSVSSFSVRMLDFGDWNPTLNTVHHSSLTAYNASNAIVASQSLDYTTPAMTVPTNSNLYGNLQVNGDATAASGMPGNWTWSISGAGIVKVVLEFGAGFDPNFGLDTLIFTPECR